MKNVEFWYWMMTDQWGRRRKSACPFQVEDALRRDPTATRVEGSCQIFSCPETPEERAAMAPSTGRFMRASAERAATERAAQERDNGR